jgi:thymidine phosphorylase
VPLIAASILSKKIAEGARGLVLDVKVGRGAFMKTEVEARRLAERLIEIAEANGLRTEAVLTGMDVPLGRAVGNAPEIVEAIETLKGQGPSDVEGLSVALTARMLVIGGIEVDPAAATQMVRDVLESGRALEVFRRVIELQEGDPGVVDDYSRLPVPTACERCIADRSGVVTMIDAEAVGQAAVVLGAGRDRADAEVDPSAGIELHVRQGEAVTAGATLATLSARDADRARAARLALGRALKVADGPPPPVQPLIIDLITETSVAGHNE